MKKVKKKLGRPVGIKEKTQRPHPKNGIYNKIFSWRLEPLEKKLFDLFLKTIRNIKKMDKKTVKIIVDFESGEINELD